MKRLKLIAASGLLALTLYSVASAKIVGAQVERIAADQLSLSWSSPNPVDIYAGDSPDFPLDAAHALNRSNASGKYTVSASGRRYFEIVDARDKTKIEVAERLVPLEKGSNFRDIGGYEGAGGKHVRWGLLYRSGGQPLLSQNDTAQIKRLGIAQVVDLRSTEERALAPTQIMGVPYSAVGYRMSDLMGTRVGEARNGTAIYRNFPTLLAPQLRLIFANLLSNKTPIVYNCSAGQDRTGFVTAMILTALGVSRETIIQDYHLSTQYRRPEFEMPRMDAAAHPGDPAAQLFAKSQERSEWKTPQPLKEADGTPFLLGAFAEIDAKWGSMDKYLEKEIGVGKPEIAKLRQIYLQ